MRKGLDIDAALKHWRLLYGPENRKVAPLEEERDPKASTKHDLTERLSETKDLLVRAYSKEKISLREAESIARRMRQRYRPFWRAS